MKQRARRLVIVALILTLASSLSAQLGRIGITLTPVTEADGVHAGTSTRVAVRAALSAGFHVNSNAPRDELLVPTVLSLEPPDGITVEGLAFPEAGLLEQTGAEQPLEVFDEEFTIGVTLAVAADLAPAIYVVPATLRYQACDETMCYFPSTADVTFEVAVVAADQTVTLIEPGLFDGLTVEAPVEIALGGSSLADPTPPGDDAAVLSRLDRFTVLRTTGGYLDAGDFLTFIADAESGRPEQGLFEGRGPLAILLLVVLGGLALNLTPCVLPMIPINLAIIGAGARSGSRARGFMLGTAYGLAMALVYGILGLVVILTAGTFGTINASPWFNVGIAALFVVLGLAMFDVLFIDFSRLQSRFAVGDTERGSFLVAFAMGGVAALLAGACVAPVVIQVIVFSSNLYATGTTIALLLPFFLGVGMALPWPIAGGGLTFMPKPGPWMVWVKHAFGVFILGTAVYYGYIAYGLFSQRWVDATEVADSVQELLDEGWYASLDRGLATAEAENKFVLVDVWATWCKNCLTMDKTTLRDAGVKAALDDYVKIKFQAEDMGVAPAAGVMKRFDAIGLPAYAILRPAGGGPSADASRQPSR
jgi:cytochrome c biogenesis protein CcdA